MNKSFIFSISIAFTGILLITCTKDKGIDPELAFRDKALLDSAQNSKAFTYYKNVDSLYPGTSASPHGSFKLKFNKIAATVLTDNGKLPLGSKFPEGSMIVKEITRNGSVVLYANMYKSRQSWLWNEIAPDGTINHSVKGDPSVCTNCHKQTGNRDLVVSFYFY
jgi:hypothetical protein